MTSEEVKALRVAADTIRRLDYDSKLADSFRDEDTGRISALARGSLQERGAQSIAELLEARLIVEAHATTGQPFPATAEELRDLLEAPPPEWLAYLPGRKAAEWQAAARAIVAAVGAKLPECTSAGEPPLFPHIHTTKSDAALRKIFRELVAEGYIAGTDEDGREMLEDFIATFERDSRQLDGIVYSTRPQGRIIWAKKARNGAINKAALLDFLYLNGAHDWQKWKKLAAAVFGVELTANDQKRYANDRCGILSEHHTELDSILK